MSAERWRSMGPAVCVGFGRKMAFRLRKIVGRRMLVQIKADEAR
jgi:hypothetical protein